MHEVRYHPMRRTRAALTLAASLLLAACTAGTGSSTAAPSAAASAAPSAAPASAPAASHDLASCPTKQPDPLPAGQTRTVTLNTEKGAIVIAVSGSLSPIAAGNFVALAQCGYYDNVVFHRLVPDFVIQGGDGTYGRKPNVDASNVGTGGPSYTITDEPVTADYVRGTVAMAKTQQPNSANSQFFIVLADVDLPKTYQIFGRVTSGMDVVDTIAAMPNSGAQTGNQALQPVAMQTVTVANP